VQRKVVPKTNFVEAANKVSPDPGYVFSMSENMEMTVFWLLNAS